MYNNKKHKNPDRITEIFRKCNKLGNTCYTSSPKNLTIFIQIINKYAYFDLQGLEKSEELQLAIEYFVEKYPEFEKEANGDPVAEEYIRFWNKTKAYLNSKVEDGTIKISTIE